ncbi:MAG: hypothetical protein K2J35_01015, partial [Eubacterium sp.]|nr:hypothetical protein [Eubacterium sp.]
IVMTIPFRCAARNKRNMKPGCSNAAFKICVKMNLRKQAHYRAREGEWAQRKLNRIVMCAGCSFKHK